MRQDSASTALPLPQIWKFYEITKKKLLTESNEMHKLVQRKKSIVIHSKIITQYKS